MCFVAALACACAAAGGGGGAARAIATHLDKHKHKNVSEVGVQIMTPDDTASMHATDIQAGKVFLCVCVCCASPPPARRRIDTPLHFSPQSTKQTNKNR